MQSPFRPNVIPLKQQIDNDFDGFSRTTRNCCSEYSVLTFSRSHDQKTQFSSSGKRRSDWSDETSFWRALLMSSDLCLALARTKIRFEAEIEGSKIFNHLQNVFFSNTCANLLKRSN